MHTLIHRALSPQTISYAWLVLTVALTFALAVAQSAIAAGTSLSAVGLPAAHVALIGPASPSTPAPDAARCRAADPAEDQRAAAPAWAAGRHAACRALGLPPGPAIAGAPVLTPATPHRGAALAALYGGAGPHGPPAAAGIHTISPVVARVFRERPRPRLQPEPCPLGHPRALRARRRGLLAAHARHRDTGMSRTPCHRPVADRPRAARRRVATCRCGVTRAARGHACPVHRTHRTVVPRG